MKRLLLLLALSSQLLALSSSAATLIGDTTLVSGKTLTAAGGATVDLSAATVAFANNQLAIAKVNGLQAALDLKAALASPTFTGTVTLPSTTSIGSVSATELGYLDGVTSAIQTQLNARPTTTAADAAYQPHEDQRLGTSYSTTFAGLTLNGALTGASGDTLANPTPGYWSFGTSGAYFASERAQIDNVGQVYANGFSDTGGNGYQGFSYNVINNPSYNLWDFGDAGVSFASGQLTIDGSSGVISTTGVFAGGVYQMADFGFSGAYHTLTDEIDHWNFGSGGLIAAGSNFQVDTTGSVYAYSYNTDGSYYGSYGNSISNTSSNMWDLGSAGLSAAYGAFSISSGGDVTAFSINSTDANLLGTLYVTNITSIDSEVDFAVPIRAQHLLTSGTPAFYLGGVAYYAHAAAGVLTFTTTP